MYKHYFGFSEPPFSIAPDPRYLYMSEMHQDALAHLSYGASSEGCIILLTGEVGTGKTTICRCFLERLSPNTTVAVIINPKLTAEELLAAICDEFRISPPQSQPTAKNYIDCLNSYLLKAHAEGRQAVLVIDEAQNLDLDILELLRLLTNLETDKQKLLKIILLGQSELAKILSRPDLEQINQRVTSRYHLKGLLRQDVETYINHRIAIAGGGRPQLFSRKAIKKIFAFSRGIPRLINSLCDRALLGAYAEGSDRVNSKIISRAAREIFGEPQQSQIRTTHVVTATVFALLFILLAFWLTSTTLLEPDAPPAEQAAKKLETTTKNALGETVTLSIPEPAATRTGQPESSPAAIENAEPQQKQQKPESTRIIIEPIEITD